MNVTPNGSTLTIPTSHDKNQLAGSIEKLFHYTAALTKHDINITVRDGNRLVGKFQYAALDNVNVSPTLYTRIDDCHGAGNCCRVPFDLVYSDYDRRRIENFNYDEAEAKFGKKSALNFQSNKQNLLDSLHPLQCDTGMHSFRLWARRNTEVFYLSDRKSCPYLLIDDDRYFCGVHPFKPLHCWMPHMTLRYMGTGVSIGRMQYGRNHKFGCPVKFLDATSVRDEMFGTTFAQDYFDSGQYESDIEKLKWIEECAGSMGFDYDQNAGVGLFGALRAKAADIRSQFRAKTKTNINLWSRDE